MNKNEYTHLSKTLSHALRHAPWLYELELDEEGWTPIESVLQALRVHRKAWADVTVDDLSSMMAQSSKQRFQIAEGRIRAYYGHSVEGKLRLTPAKPPAILYHGTAPKVAPVILQSGLRPMQRQYVHLSTDVQTARKVGSRKATVPILLRIDAEKAHTEGVVFYLGNENVWLADHVPPAFIFEESH